MDAISLAKSLAEIVLYERGQQSLKTTLVVPPLVQTKGTADALADVAVIR
jgi:hypothetical protein